MFSLYEIAQGPDSATQRRLMKGNESKFIGIRTYSEDVVIRIGLYISCGFANKGIDDSCKTELSQLYSDTIVFLIRKADIVQVSISGLIDVKPCWAWQHGDQTCSDS